MHGCQREHPRYATRLESCLESHQCIMHPPRPCIMPAWPRRYYERIHGVKTEKREVKWAQPYMFYDPKLVSGDDVNHDICTLPCRRISHWACCCYKEAYKQYWEALPTALSFP